MFADQFFRSRFVRFPCCRFRCLQLTRTLIGQNQSGRRANGANTIIFDIFYRLRARVCAPNEWRNARASLKRLECMHRCGVCARNLLFRLFAAAHRFVSILMGFVAGQTSLFRQPSVGFDLPIAILLRLRRPPRPAAHDEYISESLAIRNELNKNVAASAHTNEF